MLVKDVFYYKLNVICMKCYEKPLMEALRVFPSGRADSHRQKSPPLSGLAGPLGLWRRRIHSIGSSQSKKRGPRDLQRPSIFNKQVRKVKESLIRAILKYSIVVEFNNLVSLHVLHNWLLIFNFLLFEYR